MNHEGELVSPAAKVINLITKMAIDRSSNWIRHQEILSTAQTIYVK